MTTYLLHIFASPRGRLDEDTLRFTDQLVAAIDPAERPTTSPSMQCHTDEGCRSAIWLLALPGYPDGLVQQVRVLWEGKAAAALVSLGLFEPIAEITKFSGTERAPGA